jgi:hypothetical protein
MAFPFFGAQVALIAELSLQHQFICVLPSEVVGLLILLCSLV